MRGNAASNPKTNILSESGKRDEALERMMKRSVTRLTIVYVGLAILFSWFLFAVFTAHRNYKLKEANEVVSSSLMVSGEGGQKMAQEEVVESFQPVWHEKLQEYRIGNALTGWDKLAGIPVPFVDWTCLRYPGSIVCDYRLFATNYSDYDTLGKIVRTRGQIYHTAKQGCFSLPGPTDVVVHLRLGDSVIAPDCFQKGCNKIVFKEGEWKEVNKTYVFDRKYYENLFAAHVDLLKHKHFWVVSNIDRRSRSAWTKNATLDYNMKYREEFIHWLRNTVQPASIRLRNNCQPDQDLTFFAHGGVVIGAGGSFSRVLMCVAKTLNGTVLNNRDRCKLGRPMPTIEPVKIKQFWVQDNFWNPAFGPCTMLPLDQWACDLKRYKQD